ncbi:transcriptional regulator, LysR family [Nocardioides szechwanensis]|uniref:Transcriptional regulator, LysR family n=1 Tax=Nocardioides szechwanensis TaxID=1005944 RepID=A0A1G9ZQN4_9ACTN|nr:LysR family transcriptional regulator [Nocardioides szechwanensis]SDN23530.1 transcriptional regulator, LysR family [Nocardioides szechwanensis]
MDVRRLRLLLELSRLGSMRQVAEELGYTTSTVSQQLAALAREAGTPLVEPDGRRVRLTPAGRRLADHAVTILAAVEAARLDLGPDAEPAGTVRVAGFATAVRRSLLPVVDALSASHPRVRVHVHEYEPLEAFDLLAADDVDLALTYDYNLAPAGLRSDLDAIHLWDVEWGLGVPSDGRAPGGDAAAVFAAFSDHPWIVNSRNTADEDAVRTLASMAGFTPRIEHQIDSLDLVEDLILAGLGVGLLPRTRRCQRGVRVLPLRDPGVVLRAYAVTRRGREDWPPLRLVVERLRTGATSEGTDPV